MSTKFVPALLLTLLPLTASAELGGNAASVQTDNNKLHAVMRATVSNGYTVHAIQTESGITIREYLSTAGKVFAVSWDGPVMPDLQQLLGQYFPAFSEAAAARRHAGIRGPVAIAQEDLVVQSGGRMRAFAGRAYVPSSVPPQVTIDEIQ